MRAFVNHKKMTAFMQATDMYRKPEVMFMDLDLQYEIDGIKVTEETDVLRMAQGEFGQDLIVLFGKEKPLWINPEVQVIHEPTGEGWVTLHDALMKMYPGVQFETDQHRMNIQVKQNV